MSQPRRNAEFERQLPSVKDTTELIDLALKYDLIGSVPNGIIHKDHEGSINQSLQTTTGLHVRMFSFNPRRFDINVTALNAQMHPKVEVLAIGWRPSYEPDGHFEDPKLLFVPIAKWDKDTAPTSDHINLGDRTTSAELFLPLYAWPIRLLQGDVISNALAESAALATEHGDHIKYWRRLLTERGPELPTKAFYAIHSGLSNPGVTMPRLGMDSRIREGRLLTAADTLLELAR